MMSGTKVFTTAAALLTIVSLAGCAAGGSTSSEGSRAKLYGSTAELLGDTDLVVVGTAAKPTSFAESDTVSAHTVTTVTVTVVVAGKGVGPLSASSSTATTVGSTVDVRQLGTASEGGGTAAAVLQEGKSYLLFLTPSELPGSDAAQFYPVGGTAGVWAAGSSSTFSRLIDEGDRLPSSLTTKAVATTTPAITHRRRPRRRDRP